MVSSDSISYVCFDLHPGNRSFIVKMPPGGEKMKINLPPGNNPMDMGVTHFSSESMNQDEVGTIRNGPCILPQDAEYVTQQSPSAPAK